MIADALQRGCRKFLIGIGGSATNDGGLGMMRALGFKLLDREGCELLGDGASLEQLSKIDASGVMKELSDAEFIVACDVNNPLYGERGAAYVYAPQKGADAAMVKRLDAGLRNYARVVESFSGEMVADMPGAGAAGGLGAGFKAMLGARLERGIDMVLGAMHFDQIIKGSDLVVTGEGRLDRQTVMGKAPSGVLQAASLQGIPTVAIGGAVAWCEELAGSGFVALLPIVAGPTSLEVAMQRDVATENVRRTAVQIAKMLSIKTK
jgi:glycerate kinase